jgi:dTDP-4-amino-4,6-dideoxygalactose transaminase
MWLTAGHFTNEFERDLEVKFNKRHAMMVNSGSSANLLAMTALELPKGSEVITCATAFPTTVNSIAQCGLVPVFVDCELGTWNLDASLLSKALSDKTKAVIVAHTLDNPADMQVISGFCKQHGLRLIEDSCDAAAALYDNQPVGTWGDFSTYSFYPAHQITTGEGGALLTDSAKLAKIATSYRDWGRDCFPAGTKVEANGILKNIEDVVVGDLVISHAGELRQVTKLTGKRDTSFVKIKPRLMKEILCTNNHPFLVADGNWMQAKFLKKGDYVLEAIPKQIANSPAEFTYSYKTDYQEKTNTIPIESDLMRLIGYWLAEGSLASGKKGGKMYKEGTNYLFHRVDFAFHVKEEETIEDVCNLMHKYFRVVGYARQKPGTLGVSLSFKTRNGYEFFSQFFGKGASNKRLPRGMENWDLSLGLDQIIKGFWIGDGSSSKQGFSLCSTSEILINQMRRLLLRYEIAGSFHERKPSNHMSSVINGKTVVAKHTLHSIGFYGRYAERFGSLVGEEFPHTGERESGVFFDVNYVHYPIDKIERMSTFPINVYNLEVEVDHSYHVNGIAVHNCWCAPGCDNTCGKRFDGEFDHKYLYSRIGYNLKSTDLQAAIGISQLKKLDRFVEKRLENFHYLSDGLKDLPILFPHRTPNSNPSWFGFAFGTENRNGLARYLDANKIGNRPLFAGNITRHPAYKDVEYRIAGELINCDYVMENVIWVGVWPGLTTEMLNYVIYVLKDFYK